MFETSYLLTIIIDTPWFLMDNFERMQSLDPLTQDSHCPNSLIAGLIVIVRCTIDCVNTIISYFTILFVSTKTNTN